MRQVSRSTFVALAIWMTVVGAGAAQTCIPAPTGLVGWWPGNGSAQDMVAGNDGQLVGGAGFTPGVVGGAFALDGINDYVEIPDSPALKPAHVSVEAWVRFDSLDTPITSQYAAPGVEYIVFKKNTRVFNFEAYALRKQRVAGIDRLAFSIGDSSGFGTLAVALSSTAVSVGEVYHVVGTYDGAAVRLYVNGALEGQAAVSVPIDYGTRPVFIGTSGETVFDGKLQGFVDEASLYNRALGADEVAGLYAAGSGGKCLAPTGLLASLATLVQVLNISAGISNSLDVKLQNALRALDDASAGNTQSACGRVGAFLNEVAAQTGRELTNAQASQLASLGGQVELALACR